MLTPRLPALLSRKPAFPQADLPRSLCESIHGARSSNVLRRMGASPERKVDLLKLRLGTGIAICLIGISAAVSVGCSSSSQGAKAPEPPAVEVVQVEQKDVPIYNEWIGTTDGMVNADIK